MRYFQDHTQQQIADEIGVTQMQVSRLLSSILAKLRHELGSGEEAALRGLNCRCDAPSSLLGLGVLARPTVRVHGVPVRLES